MPKLQGSFIWYELMTSDIGAAKRFYDSVVGWTIDAQSALPNEYRMIGRSDGKYAGGVLPISDDMKQHGARPLWIAYVGVDDVDAQVGQITGDGGKVMMPAFDIPGIGRVAMVTDPAGTPFYIMKPIPPERQPDAESDVFSIDQPQHVRWNELASADQDGVIAFFTRQFGWTQEGAMPMGEMGEMGEMGDYKFVNHDGVRIGAVMRKPTAMPMSMWTFYIGVDDIDRAARAVTEGGGQIVHGPSEIPGGEFSIHAIDPQGASFGLVGPRN